MAAAKEEADAAVAVAQAQAEEEQGESEEVALLREALSGKEEALAGLQVRPWAWFGVR